MSPSDERSRFCDTCGAQLFPGSTFCRQCGMKIIQKKEEPIPIEKKIFSKPGLYQMYSLLTNFRYQDHYYDNVKINWFVTERKEPPIPFDQAIEDYDGLPFLARVGPENFVKQSFTLKEAELLKQYLNSVQKIKVVIEECPLPVKPDASGYRDTPPPPGTDSIFLHKKSRYNLPFKVEGIFNTKMADEQIMGDDLSVTVVSGINVKDLQKYIKEKQKEKEKENFS